MRIGLTLPYAENEVKRRCGTCLHYQASPLSGQGWCRNRDLRSEQERALVSRKEHRCYEMLDDYWEPAPDTDRGGGNSAALASAFSAFGLPPIRKQFAFALLFAMILLVSAVGLFSNSVLSTPVVSSPTNTKASLVADAKQDFWLRDEATSAMPSLRFIPAGSTLELVDSKAGEVLDPTLPSPAKWYLLRASDSGDTGWAYSGWVERH